MVETPIDSSRSPARLGAVRRYVRTQLAGVRPAAAALIVAQFLMNASTFMSLPLLALYMAGTLGYGAGLVGTVLSLNLIATRGLPLLVGPLADRYGHRRFLILGLAVRAAGFAMLVVWSSPIGLSTAAIALGFGATAYESAVYGLLAREPETVRPRLFLLNNQALNLGVIVGPAMGMAAAVAGAVAPFAGSAILFAVLTGAALILPLARGAAPADGGSVLALVRRAATDRAFVALNLALVPWWFLFAQLYATFPLRFAEIAGGDRLAGSIFLVNGTVGVLFALVALPLFARVSAGRLMVAGQALLAAAFLAASGAGAVVTFLAFVAVYTVGESLMLPASDTATAGLAPRGGEATYFGLSNLSWMVGGSAGNYAGSWLALNAPAVAGWWVFAGVAAIGTLGLAAWHRAYGAAAAAGTGDA